MLKNGSSIPVSIASIAAVGALMLVACGQDLSSPVRPDEAPVGARPIAAADTESGSEAGSLEASSSRGLSGFTCRIDTPEGPVFTTRSRSVLSSSGKETETCRGRVSSAPKSALVIFNVNCYLPITQLYSNISQVWIDASGEVKLLCQSR